MPKVTTSVGDLCFVALRAKAPFRETLEWLTFVDSSFDGTESRVPLRSMPRQSFEMDLEAQYAQTQDIQNCIYGAKTNPWAVPVWSEEHQVGTVLSGQTSVTVPEDSFDYRVGELALIWSPTGAWKIVTVAAVAGTNVTISAPGVNLRGALMVPVRRARIRTPARKQTIGYGSRWKLNFDVLDNIALTSDEPTQYLGHDVYFEPGLMGSSGLDESYASGVVTMDGELGNVYREATWNYSRISRPYMVVTETPQESWAFRLWLHRRAGRYRPFWQPSFENDFRLASDNPITNQLIVHPDSWPDFGTDRLHVAIQTDDTWYTRAITASDLDGDTLELTMSSSIGGVDPANVKRVCYLGLKRLDTDSVDLDWASNGVCTATVPVIEISP